MHHSRYNNGTDCLFCSVRYNNGTDCLFCSVRYNNGTDCLFCSVRYNNGTDCLFCSVRYNNGTDCQGPSKQFKLCILQNCTDASSDYRATECAKHNKVYYGGQTFSWVPYINSEYLDSFNVCLCVICRLH
ncbi:hypothetical protein BsWGS_02132 [Bradybaena similaris]